MAAQQLEPRSTRDGVFSTAQVDRGEEAFLRECTECHELVEFIGPDAYFESMLGESLWEILDFIWSEMPEDSPAWLESDAYVDILSYLLSAYGLPAGTEDLPMTRAELAPIMLERPEPAGTAP